MSIIGDIMGKIFSGSPAQASTGATAAPGSGVLAPNATANPFPNTANPSAQGASSAVSSSTAKNVDVFKILAEKAKSHQDSGNWKTSIVDLLKVLELDSSMKARQELARELSYTGDTQDSAAMNIWLHKQVLKKFAENGGTIPEDLKH